MIKSKFKIIYIGVILLSILLIILFSPIFHIKEINIDEKNEYIGEIIYEKIDLSINDNTFLTLLKNGNIFSKRLAKIENSIYESFPLLKDVKVIANYNGIVNISYNIKTEALEFEKDNMLIVTDDTGFILKTQKEHKIGNIRVTGVSTDNYKQYSKLGIEENILNIINVIYNELYRYDEKYYTAFRESIDWVDFSSSEDILIMYDNRILVKMNYEDDTEYDITTMCLILSENIDISKSGVLDLTVSGKSIFMEK